MKTTKTKTARIVIGELPSAGTSGPLNLNSAAVATVHGGGFELSLSLSSDLRNQIVISNNRVKTKMLGFGVIIDSRQN